MKVENFKNHFVFGLLALLILKHETNIIMSLNILGCTLDWSRVQIPLNQFGLIWSKLNPALDLAWILVLQMMSTPFLFSFFFRFEPIDFPSKMVPWRFSLYLPLFGFEPSSKGHGSNLWLSSNRITLFHWTLNLGPSSKVALRSWAKGGFFVFRATS
jgi:hypothetical protein